MPAFFRSRNLSTDWDAVKQTADANLVTSLSMVLPFGPAEKQALLEAADSSARAKLLIAFLEMNAFAPPSGHDARQGQLSPRAGKHDMIRVMISTNLLHRAAPASTRSCWKSWSARPRHGPLEYDAAAGELISRKAGLAYPIRDGIPIMLVSEARQLRDAP